MKSPPVSIVAYSWLPTLYLPGPQPARIGPAKTNRLETQAQMGPFPRFALPDVDHAWFPLTVGIRIVLPCAFAMSGFAWAFSAVELTRDSPTIVSLACILLVLKTW